MVNMICGIEILMKMAGSKYIFILAALSCIQNTIAAPLITSHPSTFALGSSLPRCSDLPELGMGFHARLCFLENLEERLSNSQIEPRALYRTSLAKNGGYTEWCDRNSQGTPQAPQNDIDALCKRVPDTFTIRRTNSTGKDYDLAVCEVFDQGGARLRLCNFDRCGAQTFTNLKQTCVDLNAKCSMQGHPSAYKVGENKLKQMGAATLTGTRLMGDYTYEQNDDAFFKTTMKNTCGTTDPKIVDQDYTGPGVRPKKQRLVPAKSPPSTKSSAPRKSQLPTPQPFKKILLDHKPKQSLAKGLDAKRPIQPSAGKATKDSKKGN